jgi:hypothetical protein
MNRFAAAFAAIALVTASASPLMAAPCKDAKGKFTKCPEKPVVPVKKGPCKDAKGKFTKCK